MKDITVLMVFLFVFQIISAQDLNRISLEKCQENARNNYPLGENQALLDMNSRLKIDNIHSRYLPELNISAKATYQSDVPGISFSIPNFPSLNIPKAPKDQYGLSLDINQLIYDGGRGKMQEKLEMASLEAEKQLIEVELYQLKTRINEVYFTLLGLQENIRLISVKKDELLSQLISVRSAVKNGVMLISNKYHLEAEVLTIEQKLVEFISARDAAIEVLSELTGEVFGSEVKFDLPEVELKNKGEYYRPEQKLFDLQTNQIDALKLLTEKQRMPLIGGFGQFGYGNPGLNMLNDEFDSYFIVGARMSWNMYDWKRNSRDRKSLDINKEIIDNNRKTFSLNQQTKLKSEMKAVGKYEQLLKLDDEIIMQRTNIKNSAASQLKQGIISSSDFVRFLNAESHARINKEYHLIMLVQAKINFNNTYGD